MRTAPEGDHARGRAGTTAAGSARLQREIQSSGLDSTLTGSLSWADGLIETLGDFTVNGILTTYYSVTVSLDDQAKLAGKGQSADQVAALREEFKSGSLIGRTSGSGSARVQPPVADDTVDVTKAAGLPRVGAWR